MKRWQRIELWILRIFAMWLVVTPCVLFVYARMVARTMPLGKPAYPPAAQAQYIVPGGNGGVVINASNVAITIQATAVQQVIPTGTFSVSVFNTVGVVVWPSIAVAASTSTVGVVVWPSPPVAPATVWVANSPGTNPQNTVYVTGVPAPLGSVWVSNGTASPIPVAISAVPTTYVTGVPVPPNPVGTVWVSNGTASPLPVAISAVPTVYVTGVVPPVATVFINNSTASPVNAWVANPIGTMFISNPTASAVNAYIVNTPAVQGSVSVNFLPTAYVTGVLNVNLNTPAMTQPVSVNTVQASAVIANSPGVVVFPQQNLLASATTTNTVMPNSMITSNALPVLGLGYDATGSSNAYRAVAVDASGNQKVNLAVTPAMPTVYVTGAPAPLGTVWVSNASASPIPIATGSANFVVNMNLNTPAMTVPVSVNTVQVSAVIANTPAVQGSVSINNTPAVQGSVSLNNTPGVQVFNTVAVQVWPSPLPIAQHTINPCSNPEVLPTSLPLNIVTSPTAIVATPAAANRLIVCGVAFTNGAAASVQFFAASATATLTCPSPTAVTGAMVGNFTSNGQPAFTLGTGQKLCALPVGTALSVQGVVTYVQIP